VSQDLNVLGISGSLRRGSYNTRLLETIKAMLPPGMALEIAAFDGLPIYNGDDEDKSGIPPSALDFIGRIRVADAVIIATPEYNFSIPGGLKNAIDWVSRIKQQPFRHKRVGIVGASGGPIGTARSQYHLRQALQALEAYVMPGRRSSSATPRANSPPTARSPTGRPAMSSKPGSRPSTASSGSARNSPRPLRPSYSGVEK
jgi:chromate reductase